MTEKNYVINVKTKLGTIVTVRADSTDELKSRINEAITSQLSDFVLALEEAITGAQPTPSMNDAVSVVQNAFPGAQVISTTPIAPAAPAPVAQAPVASAPAGGGAQPACRHGQMNYVDGAKFGKTWKAWMCPQPKEAVDKCAPQWIK